MKILIVDDWVSNALLVRGHLKPLDVEAEIFTEPMRALYWCCHNDPDLIFLDYQMPQMDAAEFLGRLRIDDRLKSIPVIVVTWDETQATRLRVLEAGAKDVVCKPIDHLKFITRVRDLLELRRAQNEFTTRSNSPAHQLATRAPDMDRLRTAWNTGTT